MSWSLRDVTRSHGLHVSQAEAASVDVSPFGKPLKGLSYDPYIWIQQDLATSRAPDQPPVLSESTTSRHGVSKSKDASLRPPHGQAQRRGPGGSGAGEQSALPGPRCGGDEATRRGSPAGVSSRCGRDSQASAAPAAEITRRHFTPATQDPCAGNRADERVHPCDRGHSSSRLSRACVRPDRRSQAPTHARCPCCVRPRGTRGPSSRSPRKSRQAAACLRDEHKPAR